MVAISVCRLPPRRSRGRKAGAAPGGAVDAEGWTIAVIWGGRTTLWGVSRERPLQTGVSARTPAFLGPGFALRWAGCWSVQN